MNFTDFEHLRHVSAQMSSCLNDCIEAERNARMRPMHTLTVARRALENLFMEQCKKYGVYFSGLMQGIDAACPYLPGNREKIKRQAHFIRRRGNDDVHPDEDETKLVHAATDNNINRAIKVLHNMYDVLSMIYGAPAGCHFDEMRIPFDEYEIIRKIKDRDTIQLERYFVRGANNRTYYLQSLSHQKMAELEARRNEANQKVYENLRRGSRLLLPVPLPVPENSDRKLLIYEAYPKSILLDEQDARMPLKDALNLGLDLIDALEELNSLGMHHRNICPSCVLVDPLPNGGYEAYLLDLQLSKIINSDLTVNAKLISEYDRSNYVPSSLWTLEQLKKDVPWEQVDVYAVCKVVLFCIQKGLVQANNISQLQSHSELKNADALLRLYKSIYRRDDTLRSIPTLSQLRRYFEDAKNHCH